jgi:Uncharacterized protein conserved in bacteria
MGFLQISIGDSAVLRKPHPCGADTWAVTRVGADIGLQCTRCGRKVMLDREEFERRVRTVTPNGALTASAVREGAA